MRLIYSRNAPAALERPSASLAEHDPTVTVAAAEAITSAVEILAHHPFIGRVVAKDLRELVISFGRTGYVALYRVVAARGDVRILGLRHQRELDYPP